MKSSNKIFSAVTMIFALFAFTVFVSAQTTNDNPNSRMKSEKKMEKDGMRGKRGMRGHRGNKGMMRGLHQLDLTDTQKEQIRGIMETNRIANEPLHQELRSLMQKKRAAGSLTEDETARFQAIKAQLGDSKKQTHETVLALLTAEQRAKYDQMIQERKERMKERKDRFQERRQNSQKPLTKSDG